ncbi:hypothetical protein [Sorangium sp. So ce590]|uniref:hypothetical protein n=1 Tax=unclassified Sorangium TaxID=2621164 RepID=UPI003F60D795
MQDNSRAAEPWIDMLKALSVDERRVAAQLELLGLVRRSRIAAVRPRGAVLPVSRTRLGGLRPVLLGCRRA